MYQNECFSEVAILYISCSNLRSTNASSSSRIVESSLELRKRQMSIQQKLVRHISETTRNFCVSSQQAQPRCLPRTNREVRIFVLECITLSPASAKSSTRHKITYPFLCFFALRCALGNLLLSLNQLLQNLWLPRIPHCLLFIRDPHMSTNKFSPSIPGRIHSFIT